MHIKAIETRYKGYRFRSRLEARWAVFLDAVGLRWQYELEGFDFGEFRYLPDFYLPDWQLFLEVKPDLPSFDSRTDEAFYLARDGKWSDLGRFLVGADRMKNVELKPGKPLCTATNHRVGFAEPTPIHHQRLMMLCGTPGIPSIRLEDGNWRLLDGSVALSSFRLNERDNGVPVWRIQVLAFALCGGGNNLDLWPLYVDGGKSHAFHPVGKHLGEIEPLQTQSALLPGSTMRNFYVGNGVVYNPPALLKSYRAARSARFEHGETPTF